MPISIAFRDACFCLEKEVVMLEELEDGSVVMTSSKDVEELFSDEYHKAYTARKRAKMNFFERLRDRWVCRPYKYRLLRRFEGWHWQKYNIPPKMKYFVQRAKRGWSDADVWNLYAYADRVLIGMLEQLRDDNHGCPAVIFDENGNEVVAMRLPWDANHTDEEHEEEFQTQYDVWTSMLNAIISGLESIEKIDNEWPDRDRMEQLQQEHIKAIKLLAYNWQSLWD